MNAPFSNNSFEIIVRNVGDLIRELRRLPKEIPIECGFATEASLVIYNPDNNPHIEIVEPEEEDSD